MDLAGGEERGQSLMSVICTDSVLYWPYTAPGRSLGVQQTMVGHWALFWALNGHARVLARYRKRALVSPRSGLPRVLQGDEWTGIGMYMSRQVYVSLKAIVDRQIAV